MATTNSMEALDTKRKLAIGDAVSYRVVEERKTAPEHLSVTDSGELEVPYIGRVSAAGLTCRSLAEQIKTLLEKDYFYHATVILGLDAVSHQSRGVIYIMGPVVKQGPMPIPLEGGGAFTLSKAIISAGGFGDFADRHKVKLVRKNAPPAYYDVDKIFKGKGEPDPEVQPDDIIMVTEKIFNWG
jgi:polysaccharide export outer membrane protein